MKQSEETKKYGVFLSKLAIYARNLIRDLNPKNDLTFLRVQCKKYEMMIAPDKEYFLIVITNLEQQNAHQWTCLTFNKDSFYQVFIKTFALTQTTTASRWNWQKTTLLLRS